MTIIAGSGGCFDGGGFNWGISYNSGSSFESVDFASFQNTIDNQIITGKGPDGNDVDLAAQQTTVISNSNGSDAIIATSNSVQQTFVNSVNSSVTESVTDQTEVRLQDGTRITPNSFPIIDDDTIGKNFLTIPGSQAADPAFDPITAATEAGLRENTYATRAEVITDIRDAYQELIRDSLNAKAEIISGLVDAEIAFQSGLTRDQPVGPGITPRDADFDVVLSVSDYYSQIVELAEAAAIQLPAAVKFFETGAPNPLDFGFDINTGTFASNEDAELYGQARISQLERLANLGIDTVVKGYELQQAILTQNIDSFTSRNAEGDIIVNPISRQSLLEVIGQDPSVLAAVKQQLDQTGGNVSTADLRIDTLVPLAEQISVNEFNRVMNQQPQSVNSVLVTSLDNQEKIVGKLPDLTGTSTTIPTADLPTVLLGDDIQITNILDKVGANNILNTPENARVAVSTALSDYFGVDNPAGQAAIEKAVQLAFGQIPGVSDITRVLGIIRTVNDSATTLSSDQLSAQDAIKATLSVVALANPAVGILLRGLELTGVFGGPTLQEKITTLTNTASQVIGQPVPGDGGGGGGTDLANADVGGLTRTPGTVGGTFVAEYNPTTGTYDVVNAVTGEIIVSGLSQLQATQEAKTASLGDPSYFNTAAGAGDEDFPPGDIDFGPVAVSNSDPSAQATNNAEDQFVDNGTGLLVLPEDLFTETDGGLYVLTEEVEGNVENTDAESVDETTLSYYPNGLPYDDEGNLNPGWAINPETGEPYFIGGDYVDQNTLDLAREAREAAAAAATINARSQAVQQAQRKQANDGDWRVRLRLAPLADYLYKEPGLTEEGILYPLKGTDGVIFPYMPNIQTAYHANYSSYDLTHSNYRGYFYQNSYVGEVNLSAVFTAQDTKEAEYLLAVIHFFRSATKMFYGQDTVGRGSPPPLVYLQGLGEYQFNLHPCLISQFSYNLPSDVDYIRARSPNITGTNLQFKRDRQFLATNPFSAALQRLAAVGQPKGGINVPPAPNTLGLASPTYVPTKIELQITLLPTQSREQVSSLFSFSKFANGNLLRGGFW